MQRLLADFVQLSCQILFPNLYFSSGDWHDVMLALNFENFRKFFKFLLSQVLNCLKTMLKHKKVSNIL